LANYRARADAAYKWNLLGNAFAAAAAAAAAAVAAVAEGPRAAVGTQPGELEPAPAAQRHIE